MVTLRSRKRTVAQLRKEASRLNKAIAPSWRNMRKPALEEYIRKAKSRRPGRLTVSRAKKSQRTRKPKRRVSQRIRQRRR